MRWGDCSAILDRGAGVMVIRLLIGLLLFAAAPALAADGTRIAPQLAQLQAQDSLLEQLQSRTREAETRAAEAERREREAEINRLTDQAQQAQARADAEAQRNLAAQRELFIQQAKTELQNSAYSRLEIIVGGFGALITAIVVFFAWNTKETAIAAAKAGVEDVRKTLVERLTEAEKLLAKLHKHETDFNERLRNLLPGEAPKSEEDRKTVAEVAREANAKPPGKRTADEYRAIIINLLMQKKWPEMLTAAQQMRLLHEADEDFAFARFNEGYAFGQLGRSEEAIAAYDDIVARYGAAREAALRERVVRALVNKGVRLGALNRIDEEIAVYDEVIAGYGAAREAALREEVARALVNKGVALGHLNRHEEAIKVYDDVVAHYGAASEVTLRQLVAMALVNKGVRLRELHRSEEAIAAYDDVVARFGAASEAGLREEVAIALVNKGITLGTLNRSEEEIALYDDVVTRYGAASEAGLREQVARALYNKGVVLGQLDRREEAIAVYDDVVARYGAAGEAGVREQVAMALYNKACAYARKGSVADAITALQTMREAEHPLDLKQIANETDFDSIRDDPAFKKFLEENNK